jgi:hypothetical protein
MMRRLLISALVVTLVQASLPVSASAEQSPPAQGEQASTATSAPPRVYADLPQVRRTLDLQNATRGLALARSAPLQQTLRQTTSGGGGLSRQKLLLWGIIAGAGIGILALENTSPKGNDARCSSTNPQFCN